MLSLHSKFDIFKIQPPLNLNQRVCYACGIDEKKEMFFIIFQQNREFVIVEEFNSKINELYQLIDYNETIYQQLRWEFMNLDTTLVKKKQHILVELTIQKIFINQDSQIIIPYYLKYQLRNSKYGRQYIDIFLKELKQNIGQNVLKKSLYDIQSNEIQLIRSQKNDECELDSVLLYVDNLLSISSTLNATISISYINQNGKVDKQPSIKNDFTLLSIKQKKIIEEAKLNTQELEQILNFINLKLKCQELDQDNMIQEWIEIKQYRTHESQIKLRLTPSSFHQIINNPLNQQKPEQNNNLMNAAIQHGNEHEKMGIAEYQKIYPQYIIMTYQDSLLVSKQFPWLGGIPDGIIFDSNDIPIGMIEVKCPYNQRNEGIDRIPYIQYNTDHKTLDPKHYYYYQIQGYLLITQLKWCDLIVYTFQGTLIIRINRNDEFIQNMEKKLTNYYMNNLLHQRLQPPKNKLNCIQINQILTTVNI